VRFLNQRLYHQSAVCAAFALIAMLDAKVGSAGEPIITPCPTPALTGETRSVRGEVPQGILDPILREASALAKVARDQLVIVRAESVVWNDGSLGCPEPGMMYTQALVNGYWVVINAAGQTFDFRVGRGASFRLCPAGRGHPPLQPGAS
jgi:hypothetical protein